VSGSSPEDGSPNLVIAPRAPLSTTPSPSSPRRAGCRISTGATASSRTFAWPAWAAAVVCRPRFH